MVGTIPIYTVSTIPNQVYSILGSMFSSPRHPCSLRESLVHPGLQPTRALPLQPTAALSGTIRASRTWIPRTVPTYPGLAPPGAAPCSPRQPPRQPLRPWGTTEPIKCRVHAGTAPFPLGFATRSSHKSALRQPQTPSKWTAPTPNLARADDYRHRHRPLQQRWRVQVRWVGRRPAREADGSNCTRLPP